MRPENYNYLDLSETEFRVDIQTEDGLNNWVYELNAITKVTWRCTTTVITPPDKSRKNILRRYYHCHFSVKQFKKQKKSRNINCPAKMKVVIEKPSNVDGGKFWPCIVSFIKTHNHPITSAEALIKRPIGEDAKNEILQLFAKGHTVASAYRTFTSTKMQEFDEDYKTFVLDRYFCPTKTDFSNLWSLYTKQNYDPQAMLKTLEENLKNYKNTTSKIVQVYNDYAVCLCTPIMQRAACNLIHSSEILFVDATSNCDVQNHKVYLFATHSPAGGIPIGFIIASSQKEDLFNIAVTSLIEIMPTKIKPKVIITYDDLSERNVLKSHWPDSELLLCSFHVLKAVWKWLELPENAINTSHRQAIYKNFRNVLMSKTEEDVHRNTKILFEQCQYPQFTTYINTNYLDNAKIKTWCLFYRQKFITRGSDTNNCLEVMFRLLKDIPLEGTKTFNLNKLLDFVLTSVETYYKQRLLDVVLNGERKSIMWKLKPNDKNEDVNTLTNEIRNNLYYIATGKELTEDTFAPLKLIKVENINVSEVVVDDVVMNSDKHVSNDPGFMNIEIDIVKTSKERIDSVKQKWDSFSERLMQQLDDDPAVFCPAIEKFVQNSEQMNSGTLLSAGLHNAFKFNETHHNSKKGLRKGKKISAQATSVSKRKSAVTSPNSRTGKTLVRRRIKQPHSLHKSTDKNIN